MNECSLICDVQKQNVVGGARKKKTDKCCTKAVKYNSASQLVFMQTSTSEAVSISSSHDTHAEEHEEKKNVPKLSKDFFFTFKILFFTSGLNHLFLDRSPNLRCTPVDPLWHFRTPVDNHRWSIAI